MATMVTEHYSSPTPNGNAHYRHIIGMAQGKCAGCGITAEVGGVYQTARDGTTPPKPLKPALCGVCASDFVRRRHTDGG